MKALNVVARWPGSSHDSTIFARSNLHASFEDHQYGNGLLLGDGGYPLRNYLLTPLMNPITHAEMCYNQSQIRTRNIIERFFGVWKRRFPVLSLGMRLKMETIQAIIVATAVLHNLARDAGEEDPPVLENIADHMEHHGHYEEVLEPQMAANDVVRRILIDSYFSAYVYLPTLYFDDNLYYKKCLVCKY